MRFKEFIVESKQRGDLYHFTTILSLLKIVKSNTLGEDYGGHERISLTRNENFWKEQKKNVVPTECYLIIDGDKLSHNYSIKEFGYDVNKEGWTGIKKDKPGYVEYQFEEQVKGRIKDLKKYVKKIIIFELDLESYAFDEDWLQEVAPIIEKEWEEITLQDILNFIKNKGFIVEFWKKQTKLQNYIHKKEHWIEKLSDEELKSYKQNHPNLTKKTQLLINIELNKRNRK